MVFNMSLFMQSMFLMHFAWKKDVSRRIAARGLRRVSRAVVASAVRTTGLLIIAATK